MSYTLVYFNARGRGEVIRLIFAAAKVAYTDKRFPIDFANFAKAEFDVEKAKGSFDYNMGSVPVLIHEGPDGKKFELGQSKTIERYLAKKFDLLGSNDEEAALVDMITEHIRDIKLKYNDTKVGKKGDELTAAKNAFVNESLPTWFGKLEKALSGNGFAVGDRLSYADIAIFDIVHDYFDDKEGAFAATANTPKIRNSASIARSAVQDWLNVRPDTKV